MERSDCSRVCTRAEAAGTSHQVRTTHTSARARTRAPCPPCGPREVGARSPRGRGPARPAPPSITPRRPLASPGLGPQGLDAPCAPPHPARPARPPARAHSPPPWARPGARRGPARCLSGRRVAARAAAECFPDSRAALDGPGRAHLSPGASAAAVAVAVRGARRAGAHRSGGTLEPEACPGRRRSRGAEEPAASGRRTGLEVSETPGGLSPVSGGSNAQSVGRPGDNAQIWGRPGAMPGLFSRRRETRRPLADLVPLGPSASAGTRQSVLDPRYSGHTDQAPLRAGAGVEGGCDNTCLPKHRSDLGLARALGPHGRQELRASRAEGFLSPPPLCFL